MKAKLQFLLLAILSSFPFAVAGFLEHDAAVVLSIFGAIWATMVLMVVVLPVKGR